MDFFERTGKMAIGSRLRLLSERVSKEAAAIYGLYGVDIRPKWFPVFFSLSDNNPKTVTFVAREIGQTHASVSIIVKEMTKAGIAKEIRNENDLRQTVVTLTEKGQTLAEELIIQCRDVDRAIEEISKESAHDLWEAIAEWERLLSEKSIFARVAEIKAEREQSEIKIVEYDDRYQEAYFRLNREWIETHWALEPHDIEQLANPRRFILDAGGYIFVALYKDEPVGVVALCKAEHPDYDYELAKLAVSPLIRRMGIGRRLCTCAIDKAKELGANTLFLESNTRLRPAIALYKKLGFRELPEFHPAYARGDIQMELKFN